MPLIEGYSKKNRGMAVFLCVFLGVFGFHRFYLGKPITGLIYMFTGGFFLVGWILDIIVILFAEEMTDAKGYRLRPFPVSKSTVEYSDKSRGVALLLCAYLGVFGVHRFYLGKPKTGLLWLCTLGLGLLGWVFDMFALIFGKAKDADGLPLPPFGGGCIVVSLYAKNHLQTSVAITAKKRFDTSNRFFIGIVPASFERKFRSPCAFRERPRSSARACIPFPRRVRRFRGRGRVRRPANRLPRESARRCPTRLPSPTIR